jgi:hypothetical protein
MMIAQHNRPIAFLSMKLSTMQQKYSASEIELLAIVKTTGVQGNAVGAIYQGLH